MLTLATSWDIFFLVPKKVVLCLFCVKKAEEVVKPKQIGIPSLLDNLPMDLRRDTSNLEEVTDPKEEKEDGELSEEND